MSSTRAWSSALSSSTWRADSCWSRTFSTIPASSSAMSERYWTSSSTKSCGCSVWTLRTPMTWSPRVSGTDSIEAMNRRWSIPRTHRKRGSAGTSGMTIGVRRGGDAAGHALAHRDVGAPDLVAVEPVRGGQGEALLVAVEEVERRDARPQRVARPVDDRVEELVPGPGGRRQARDMVEEAQLLELALGSPAPRRPARRRSVPRVPWSPPYKPRDEGAERRLRSGCDPWQGRCSG